MLRRAEAVCHLGVQFKKRSLQIMTCSAAIINQRYITSNKRKNLSVIYSNPHLQSTANYCVCRYDLERWYLENILHEVDVFELIVSNG